MNHGTGSEIPPPGRPSLDLGGNLDHTSSAVVVRRAIAPADAVLATAVRPRPVDADVLDAELESLVRHPFDLPVLLSLFHLSFLCQQLLANRCLVYKPGASFHGVDAVDNVLFEVQQLGDVQLLVDRQDIIAKSLGGIAARELARLGRRHKQLLLGVVADVDVVDGLERFFSVHQMGLGQHGHDGFGVRLCGWRALERRM